MFSLVHRLTPAHAFIITGLFCIAPAAMAQAQQPMFGASSLLKAVFALVLVLLLIFALAWYLRRLQNFPGGAGGSLKVLATLPVGQRERVILVQAGSEQLLLGVTSNSVTLLKTLDQPLLDLPASSKAGGFTSQLEKLMANPGRGR